MNSSLPDRGKAVCRWLRHEIQIIAPGPRLDDHHEVAWRKAYDHEKALKNPSINRRTFVSPAFAAGAALLAAPARLTARTHAPAAPRFTLGYGPHPGRFKASAGNNVVNQIKFAADQGFTAWEDNGIMSRPVVEQELIGQTLADRTMQMGVFVAYANFDEPTFAVANPAKQEKILTRIRTSVDVAKRCGAKWFTVVPGSVDQQAKNAES